MNVIVDPRVFALHNAGIITANGERLSSDRITQLFEDAEREYAGKAFGDGRFADPLQVVEQKLAELRDRERQARLLPV